MNVASTRQCPQCWQPRPAEDFLSDRPGAMCTTCRRFYGSGARRSPEERRARLGRSSDGPRVLVMESSGNKKLGGIAATITSAETCPDACSLKGNGCYAEFHVSAVHWRGAAERGLPWGDFVDWAAARPEGELWRHNVAGDLPGEGDALDVAAMRDLGRRAKGNGFTFTHKPLRTAAERRAVHESHLLVNLSADSPADADRLLHFEIAPVAVLVPPGTVTGARTPGGAPITVCPAQVRPGATCATCGLCAIRGRRTVVGFLPHGQMGGAVGRRLPVLGSPA